MPEPEYRITTDLFVLTNSNGMPVLYAPLAGLVCESNDETLEFLASIEKSDSRLFTSDQIKALQYFIEKGVINGERMNFFPTDLQRKFSPTQMALFPTNRCQMKCRYCYATADIDSECIMEDELAVNVVDYFIKILKQDSRDIFNLEFHGGGEPFFAWDFIQGIVEYAKEKCLPENLRLNVHAATNGILNPQKIQWITEHFTSLLISFDGLPKVQDFHRPLADGSSSFDQLDNTMKHLSESAFPFGIRCTVSRFNEDLLEETVEFISRNYKTDLLIMEPVNVCGAFSGESDIQKPDLYKFVENFKYLEPMCRQKGLRLEYSGARFDRISSTFCHVGTDDFAVTPDGCLTNCWEVTGQYHPLAETFIFGRVLDDGSVHIDREKIEYLRKLSVNHLSYCEDCFAKWHCSGDCATRLGHGTFNGQREGERCRTNRQLIAHRIIQLLEKT